MMSHERPYNLLLKKRQEDGAGQMREDIDFAS